jgi:hypothetical protein
MSLRNKLFCASALVAIGLFGCTQTPVAETPKPLASATSTPSSPPKIARAANVGPNGETVTIWGGQIVVMRASGETTTLHAETMRPGAGAASTLGIEPKTTIFLDDGTFVVGLGDGTVAMLDATLKTVITRVGLRGYITGLTPAGNDVLASTSHGVLARVTKEGEVRWQRVVDAAALSAAAIHADGSLFVATERGVFHLSTTGELLGSRTPTSDFACCKEDAVPVVTIDGDAVSVEGMRFDARATDAVRVATLETVTYTFRKISSEPLINMIATGPHELTGRVVRKGGEDLVTLNTDDGSTRRVPIPKRADAVASRPNIVLSRDEDDDEDGAPKKKPKPKLKGPPYLWIDQLVRGPTGAPWLLARRVGQPEGAHDPRRGPIPTEGQILELDGGKLRERRDLDALLSEHPMQWPRTIVAGRRAAAMLCFDIACAVYEGGAAKPVTPPKDVNEIERVGDVTYYSTEDGAVFRLDGMTSTKLDAPNDMQLRIMGGAVHELWASPFDSRTNARSQQRLRYDGKSWHIESTPIEINFVTGSSDDDLWSADARAHWDGKRWTRVDGAPNSYGVVARDHTLFVSSKAGVYQLDGKGKDLPQTAALVDDNTVPRAASIDPIDDANKTNLKATIARIDVPGLSAVTNVKSVSASGDSLWIRTQDKLISVGTDGRGKVLQRGLWQKPGRRLHAGEKDGAMITAGPTLGHLSDTGLDTFDGAHWSHATKAFLENHTLVAFDVSGDTTWVLGSATALDAEPHAVVRKGTGDFTLLRGLPGAEWLDVAATPDGGAWLAGALNPGPCGAGVLVHAKGAWGATSLTRYRATATLFAVTAVSKDEAWAVGADGAVIQVKDGAAKHFAMRGSPWLRAVASSGANDIWIGGDDGVLVHYDGKDFHKVTNPFGARAAITGIAIGRGAVWAVGPSGVLRVDGVK